MKLRSERLDRHDKNLWWLRTGKNSIYVVFLKIGL